MSYSVEIDADGLVEALGAYSVELDRQMGRAMRNAGASIAAEARTMAPRGQTHLLARGIQGIEPSGSFSRGDLSGGAVALAAYAEYVESGTRPHQILPRHRRSLRWPVAGGVRFSRRVMHPGTRPQPFMEPALERRLADILAEFDAAAELAAVRSGF